MRIVIWASATEKPDPPAKSLKKKLFEAIGKFESERAKAGQRIRFDYTFKDIRVHGKV